MSERRAALRFLWLFGAIWLPLLTLSLTLEAPEFRPWEVLAEPGAPRFVPSRTLAMQELGDLAAWTWVRALQEPRSATFTTDRFGYRNPDGDATPRIVVIGDSYVGGSGLADTDTLTARMSRQLGEPVYNFAFSSPHMPALFLADPRFAATPPEVVVLAPNQRNLTPLLAIAPAPQPPAERSVDAQLQAAVARAELSSGLTRFARFALNGWRFGLLGHPDLGALPDGKPVLRLPLALQRLNVPARARHFEQVALALAWFERRLSERGIELVFAPIPDMGNVYPELYPEAERATITKPSLIGLCIAEASARGSRVVDLPRLFRANKWPYLYRRDDSHWSERAVQLTATAINAAVRPLLPAAPAPPAALGAR